MKRFRLVALVLGIVLLGAVGWWYFAEDGLAQRDFAPSFSPDGSAFVFYSYRKGQASDLYLKKANGEIEALTQTSDVREMEPSWHPTEPRIAYAAGPSVNTMNIYIMDLETHEVEAITDGVSNGRRYQYADWTKDGAALIVSWRSTETTGVGDIVHLDLATGVETPLTFSSRQGEQSNRGVVSPDGTLIAFESSRDRPANSFGSYREIYVMDADGTNTRRLTTLESQARMPAWSVDGTEVLFNSNHEGSEGIYAVHVQSGRLRTVFAHPDEHVYFARAEPQQGRPVFTRFDGEACACLFALEGETFRALTALQVQP